MSDSVAVDLAWLYRDTRKRLADLVADLDAASLATEVPACPGWLVRDVVAHVAAVADDAVAGRITGIPSDRHNAGQVARLADTSVGELLDLWASCGPVFEEVVGAFEIWPAVTDVASHEQDIRSALGRPGARDCAAIRHCTADLLTQLWVPVKLRVVTEDGEFLTGPDSPKHPYLRDGEDPADVDATAGPDLSEASEDAGPAGSDCLTELTLSTSTFEAFRWRMGRRSRAQLAALDWSADPEQLLDHLCLFGPATEDIIE